MIDITEYSEDLTIAITSCGVNTIIHLFRWEICENNKLRTDCNIIIMVYYMIQVREFSDEIIIYCYILRFQYSNRSLGKRSTRGVNLEFEIDLLCSEKY